MERRWDLDLTYVTERILAAAFPARPEEERHRSHLRELAHVLQSKHRDKYLVRGGAYRSQPMRGLEGPQGLGCTLTVSPSEAGPGAGSRGQWPEAQLEPIWNEDYLAITAGQGLSNPLILEKDS